MLTVSTHSIFQQEQELNCKTSFLSHSLLTSWFFKTHQHTLLPWAHFSLYTINTSVCGTDVMLQRINTGLCLIGIRQPTSLITCLQEIGSQKGRDGFIFNHVNVMTCDLCFPSMKMRHIRDCSGLI